MKQLNLFDTIDLDTSMTEPNYKPTEASTAEELWSVEKLEAIKCLPFGKTYKSIVKQHAKLREEKRFMDARYLLSEWDKTWSDEF